MRLFRACTAVMMLATGAVAVASNPGRYELHGKIVQSGGRPFRETPPVIFINASTAPFTSQTLAGPGGDFRFKDLMAGMYTLTITVPDVGQIERSIDISPSFADARGRIRASFEFDVVRAIEQSHTVVASQLSVPEKAKRQYEKAHSRMEKRDVAGAIESLKKAVELAPQYTDAWNNLGTIAYQSQDYRSAETYFREALRHDPHAFAPMVNLGGALLSQGRTRDSLPINQQAVKTRPDDPLARSQLGRSYYLLGELDAAEKELQRARALDPAHFSFPQLLLARIYERRPDYAAMAEVLEEFLRYHPDSTAANRARGLLARARLGLAAVE